MLQILMLIARVSMTGIVFSLMGMLIYSIWTL